MAKLLFHFFAVLCLSPSVSLAEPALAEVRVSTRDAENWLTELQKQFGGPIQYREELIRIENPVHAEISGIEIATDLNLNLDPHSLNGRHLSFSAVAKGLESRASQLHIRDSIVRDVGGARVIVQIDSICENLHLRWPSAIVNLDGEWSDGWQNFSLRIGDGTPPEFSVGACSGPVTIQDEIRNQLQRIVQSPELWRRTLEVYLRNQLDAQIGGIWSELTQERQMAIRDDLTLSIIPQGIIAAANGGIRIPIELILKSDKRSSSFSDHHGSTDVNTESAIEESAIVLDKNFSDWLVRFLIRDNRLRERFSSSDVPALKRLMGSRLLQFFIFPDLLKFPNKSLFYFDVYALRTPQVYIHGKVPKKEVSGSMDLNAGIRQWAPVNSQYIPYIDFAAQSKISYRAEIANGMVNVELKPTQIRWAHKFSEAIQSIRPVTDRVPLDLLTDRYKSIVDVRLKFPVKGIPLDATHTLVPTSFSFSEGHFRLPLKLKID